MVECNARFTLGLVALDRVRRALPQLRERLGLAPGVLLPFCFVLDAPPGGWPADGEASAGPGWPADGEASAGPESDLWLEPATVPGPAAPGLLVARSVEGLEAVAFAARVPSGGPARARIRGSAPPRLGAQKGGR